MDATVYPWNVYNEVIVDGNVTPAFSKFIIKGSLAVATLNSFTIFYQNELCFKWILNNVEKFFTKYYVCI